MLIIQLLVLAHLLTAAKLLMKFCPGLTYTWGMQFVYIYIRVLGSILVSGCQIWHMAKLRALHLLPDMFE